MKALETFGNIKYYKNLQGSENFVENILNETIQ